MNPGGGWSAAEIKAEITRRGSSLIKLSRQHGLSDSAIAIGLRRRYPKANGIIADFLGRTPEELWPAWFVGWRDARRKWSIADLEAVLRRIEVGESIQDIHVDPAAPSQNTIQLYREKHPDFAVRMDRALEGRRGKKVTADRLEKALDALKAGATIKTQSIVSVMTLHRYRQADLDFARRFTAVYKPTRLRGLTNRYAHRETFLTALRGDELYALAMRAVPSGLPPDMADDVRSDLVVQLLTGEVAPADAKTAARRLAAAWNRTFMHHDRSLEADMGDGRTLGGLIGDPSSWREGSGSRVILPQW